MAAGLAFDFQDEVTPLLGVRRSARGLTWTERLGPGQDVRALAIAQRLDVPELLGRVIAGRGASLSSMEGWLKPTLRALMPDPSTFQDMDLGAVRLARAIRENEPIAIFGDYDVDGAASTALMVRFLNAHGRDPRFYIPDRLTEGYGPNAEALARLIDEGARLIVTVDCGTTSHDVIAEANALGANVIVVDHHQANETLPVAEAVINPNRLDDLSGHGQLAAAGVTFLLLVATIRVLRAEGWYSGARREPDIREWLDIVALATVADVVPLTGLNRAFVNTGLKVLRARHNAGLRALADVAGLASEPAAYHLGFVLGPRINAGGRVGDATLGTRLLTTSDDIEAKEIAARLEELNRARKSEEAAMVEEAIAMAERELDAAPDTAVLIVCSVAWHKGLIGLVASRLAERFGRPAIAISFDGSGRGTGSARSVTGADIGAAIRLAAETGVLVKGGGHAMAAGFTVEEVRLPDLRAVLELALAAPVRASRHQPTLSIDGALSGAGITDELMALLDQAGPYGAGHPEPRFAMANLRCGFAKPMGQGHLRCRLSGADGVHVDAVAFRVQDTECATLLMDRGREALHVAGHLRRNHWGGREKIDFVIEDVADPGAQQG